MLIWHSEEREGQNSRPAKVGTASAGVSASPLGPPPLPRRLVAPERFSGGGSHAQAGPFHPPERQTLSFLSVESAKSAVQFPWLRVAALGIPRILPAI
jgi:hypothetical protein